MHWYCQDKLTDVGESSFLSRKNKYSASTRTFKLIEKANRSNFTGVKTLVGSRKLHSVSSTGVGFQIKAREISCYCAGCRSGIQCLNCDYVDSWSVKVLRPSDQMETQEQPPGEQMERETEEPSKEHPMTAVNDFVAVKTKKSCICYFVKFKAVENDDKVVLSIISIHQLVKNLGSILQTLPAPEILLSGSCVRCIFTIDEQKKKLLKQFKCQWNCNFLMPPVCLGRSAAYSVSPWC